MKDLDLFILVLLSSSLFAILSFLFLISKKGLKNEFYDVQSQDLGLSDTQKEEAVELEEAAKESIEEKLMKLLYSHHHQALFQSKTQFWFSLIASVIGFAFIIYMIASLNPTDVKWYYYILRTIPGVIIEGVSVLFFNQSRVARERATSFFRELSFQQQIDKSIQIINGIDDNSIKSEVKARIALHIVGIDEKTPKRKSNHYDWLTE